MLQTYTVSKAVSLFLTANSIHNILVAYSGGPDSGALLHAVCAFRSNNTNLRVVACYVNHALRPQKELVQERELVEGFATRLGVPLIIVDAKPGEIEALDMGKEGGLEAAARNFRYKKLVAVCEEQGCERILTAHTLDDAMETLVMRFFSGSGAEGLSGIPASQGLLSRPLLQTTKAAVLDYMREHGLPFAVDSTNTESFFLRNKLRHVLFPVVERVFPNYLQALSTLQIKAKLDKDALTYYARDLFDRSDREAIRLDAFLESPEAVRIRALYLLIRKYRKRLPWKTVRNATLELERGKCVRVGSYELYCDAGLIRLRACAYPLQPLLFSVLVSEPYTVVDLRSGLTLSIDMRSRGEWSTDPLVNGEAPKLRKDACRVPFVVRSVKPGDTILTARGHKRVESIRQEWKLSEFEKYLVFIVEDCDGIVAVWGAHIGKGVVFRHNPNLAKAYSNGYITIEMKGVYTE